MNIKNSIKTGLALTVLVIAIVGLTAASASARIIVEEQFIYEPPEADIDGQNGGTGFDGPWISTISHGRIYWIRSPGLSFSTLPVAGNSMSRYGSAGRAQAHRLLSASSQSALTADGITIWFSVLFQEPSNQYKHGSFLFGTDAFTTDGTPTLSAAGYGLGFTIQAAPDGSTQGGGTINALAFNGSTAPIVVQGTFTPNPITATVLIVSKINRKVDRTPDELYLFNVTDLSTEPLEQTAIASITNLDISQSAFDLIAMWDSNNSITDEIRFGNTFADVVGNTPVDPTLPDVDAGNDMITWSGEPVTLNATVTNNTDPVTDLTYFWTVDTASLVDTNLTIVITGADQEDMTVQVTKTFDTDDATVVTMILAGNNVGSGKDDVIDTVTIDVYDNACKAANADGMHNYDSTDLNKDCITDFEDFAIMATAWLYDYTITEAQPLR
ncbi:MAG: hypothetical protein ACYSUX_04765 [Planctomycetota bacterium]|jgi:hypothetical protein